MPKLITKILRYLIAIAAALFFFVMAVAVCIEGIELHETIRNEAEGFFVQLGQMLEESRTELSRSHENFYDTCERKVRSAAYMIENNEGAENDAGELGRIAALLELDEIHIIDGDGVIVSGTVPEYYGLSFGDGEQIGYFKPMLDDKSLCMIQQIEPNTAEHKDMQYSAIWSSDGRYIVQIGTDPEEVRRVIRKSNLSNVLSLLRARPEIELYAIDPATGLIEGSTIQEDEGRSALDVGLPEADTSGGIYTCHATIRGEYSYCIFDTVDGHLIGYIMSRDSVYNGVFNGVLTMGAAMLLMAIILVGSVTWYIYRYVIRNIGRINTSLARITSGNLDENVNVNNTAEFAELSSHINEMISSLLGTTDILSYIISKTDIHFGVYVYNTQMKYVRFTDYIPELLRLDADEMSSISSDYHLFRDYIRKLRSEPISGEKNIYRLPGTEDRYIRIDEAMHHRDVLGVVIDMTAEIEKRRRLESERDMDLLTGLLNRRGLKSRLNELFAQPEKLGSGAIFMIDADDLKEINDRYGHSQGDRYLKTLADVVGRFGSRMNLSARLGGDEFVVFLYGYEDDQTLNEDIGAFVKLQDMIYTNLGEDQDILVRFSLGYSLTKGETNHSALLKAADDMMYENKRRRKDDPAD